jgi:transcriptional regulator with XRE-family HTH domain
MVPMSQNELARQAGVNAAGVNRIERGLHVSPTRGLIYRLIEALDLSPVETAELLIAAGFWPWSTDDVRTAAVLPTVLAACAPSTNGDAGRAGPSRAQPTRSMYDDADRSR